MDPILSSILGPVCQRLIDAAIEEYRLVRDVKEEIKNLRTTVVPMIKGVLEDAERKKVENGAILIWLKSLKQVLFDAEDVFDEIATEEALERDARDGTTRCAIVTRRLSKVRSKLVSCLCSVDHISTRRAIAHRVKDINKEFDHISKSKDSLGLIHVPNETSWSVVRPIRRQEEETSMLPIGGAHIIGRDNEMRQIKEKLLENSAEGTEATSCKKNVHVINVVGMGGVGKTTLVRHAYNNKEVENYFQLRMWVCVSSYFDVRRVTSEIIDAAASTSEKATELRENCGWDVVQNRLRVLIEGKRFLLVLDDVWEENRTKWDSLCTPLSYGARGSKIIVTTRIQAVPNITKGTSLFLTDLPSEDLWTLLQNYAFDGHDLDMQLAQVGREIVKKLKGSPLAARTIGRVLNANLDVGHWRNILSSNAWVSSDSEGSILPILKLSYDHLPGHLKQCFALCSLFPEDHRFVKDELVQLWNAHQLIRIREGIFHVESEGGVYLDKLVHMSLFEKYTDNHDQERFVMHDLIHNLADSVSKDDCLRLEDNPQNGTISETIRHVSIASDRFDLASEIEQLCNKYVNMRTFLFSCDYKFQLDPHLDNIFMKLQRLRVLRLSVCGIEELPASIGALKHLRLLDLSDNLISKLPESLCKLRNLQVLKLRRCRLLHALPRNTSALVNLRHLELDTEIASCVPGLGKLTALQELIVNGSKVGELTDMGMLKELRIWGLEGVATQEEVVRARLEAKAHLELLELKWCQSGHNRPRQHWVSEEEVVDALKPVNGIRQLSVRYYEGARSPKWMVDPSWVSTSHLVKVELRDCTKWEVLPPLGQLPCLKVLEISDMSGVRRIGPEFFFFSCCCCDDGEGGVKLAPGFPSLEELEFREMPEWEEWESPVVLLEQQQQQQQHPLLFPRLRTLELCGCEKLRELPPLPHTLTKLILDEVGLTRLPGWMERCSEDDIGRDVDVVMMPASTSTSSSSPSRMLSTLEIYDCPNITSLDDGLRSLLGGAAGLVSLEELTISNCPKLLHLVEEEGGAAAAAVMSSSSSPVVVAKKIISLNTLEARSCSPKQIATWLRQVSSLQELSIWKCPQLRCFGAGDDDDTIINAGDLDQDLDLEGALLDLAPSLRELHIRFCENLSSLPSKLRSLTRLERLNIYACPKIQRLPSAGLPQTLKKLGIYDCPELEERCREEGCPDWPLLSHIPRVDIGWQY